MDENWKLEVEVGSGSKKREFRSGESGGRQGFKERVMGVTGYKIDEA